MLLLNYTHVVTHLGHVQYSGKDGRQDPATVFQRISVRHQRRAREAVIRDVIARRQRTC